MNLCKRFTAFTMALLMIINFSIFGVIQVFAHEAMLDIDYDDCVPDVEADRFRLTAATCFQAE